MWRKAFFVYAAMLVLYALVLLFLGGKTTELFLAHPLQMFAPVVLPIFAPYAYSQWIAYRELEHYQP
jgi:hypothetical protein